MTAAQNSDEKQVLGALATPLVLGGLIVGLGAAIVSVLIVFIDKGLGWDHFLRSWLTSFIFVLSIALGGWAFTFVMHAMRAGWSVSTRRVAEGLGGNLVWIWILFLPILLPMIFGHGDVLYHWAEHGIADPESEHFDEIIAGKSGYLNAGFWSIRAVVFFALWAIFGGFYFRNSVAQDANGDVSFTHKLQRWAPLAALLYFFTQSYAIIDWVMSLEPHWFSTMYPVYYFAASACAIMAAMILAIFFLQRRGRVEKDISLEHYQDLGKLLFGFGICFWGYIAFSQFMLIWYANIPEETNWYLARTLGSWRTVSWIIFFGHFAIPFILLMSRHPKRMKPVLAGFAVWMLAIHYVDMYWLVMPHVSATAFEHARSLGELHEALAAGELDLGFHPHIIDLTLLIALVSFFVAGTAHRMRRCRLIPVGDPRLPESVAFENY